MGAVSLAEVRARLLALAAEIEAEIPAAEADPAPPAPTLPEPAPEPAVRLAWGARVSPTFQARVAWICADLDIGPGPDRPEPSWLMACIAWESGRTFSASVKNMAGSGATGLIQFMPATAADLGTSTAELAAMTAEDQLNFVWKYFRPWKGRLRSLSDLYMAILWPAGVGQAEGFVLWDKASRPTTYRQNAGLDANRDGAITKAEAAAKVAALLAEGLTPENAA